MSPNGGGGGVAGSQPMNTDVHRGQNNLWRSNSIFNLQYVNSHHCAISKLFFLALKTETKIDPPYTMPNILFCRTLKRTAVWQLQYKKSAGCQTILRDFQLLENTAVQYLLSAGLLNFFWKALAPPPPPLGSSRSFPCPFITR